MNPRAKTLRLIGLVQRLRGVAVTHRPRPGNLFLTSGTASPSGPTTKRISSDIGRTSRLTAHMRVRSPAWGPRSSSTAVSGSCVAAIIRSLHRSRAHLIDQTALQIHCCRMSLPENRFHCDALLGSYASASSAAGFFGRPAAPDRPRSPSRPSAAPASPWPRLPRATDRSRRECRLRARSRRPCVRSSRPDRRWRSRPDLRRS